MATKTPHLLVVEDESFQRLALIDILTLCDFEGITTHTYTPSAYFYGLIHWTYI
jgi:hypothetical protein